MSELGSALGTRDGKLLGEAGVTAKEKLMLLIGSVPCFGEEHVASCPDRIIGCCGQSVRMDLCAIGHMAEWLLSNGVVVREKGEWGKEGPYTSVGGEYKKALICPKCLSYFVSDGNKPWQMHNFCPNCGADMRKGGERWAVV